MSKFDIVSIDWLTPESKPIKSVIAGYEDFHSACDFLRSEASREPQLVEIGWRSQTNYEVRVAGEMVRSVYVRIPDQMDTKP